MRHFSGRMRPRPFAIWVASICALLGPVIAPAQAPQAAPGPPIIRSIDVQYTGAETVGKARILAQMRTKVGQPYSNQVVEEDIAARYRTGAIQNVRMFAQPEGDGVKVIVAVQTRAILREIEISGAERIKPGRLRKEIKLKLNQAVDEKQLEEARQKIIEVYQGRGFTDVSVQFRIDPIDEKRGTARVVFTVNEGVKGAARAIHFEGNAHFSERVLRKQMKTRGRTPIYFMDKNREEGDHSAVSRSNMDGNTRTKDKVIRREVRVPPGDVFSTVRVDMTKNPLENLGYFAKVETYPEETDIPGRKDLTILVQEKRTGSLSFGGGYSTVDALVGFAELTQGNFDLFNWPSFTGGGQKFRLRIQYGTERKDFVLSITEPYFLDRRLSLNGQVFYTEANYLSAEYNQRNYGLATELRKPINAYTSATLGYQLQEIDIFDVAASASEFIQSQKGSFTESKVFGGVVFDSRDNPLLSRRGRRISFSPYIAGGFLGGDTQIYGLDLEASQYFHLPWDTILVINGEVATVSQWGNGNDVPIFERLYLGGSNNLRGFPFREVGPQDENGEPLGGKSMWRTTIEWTFPIIEKAWGAVFYDTGFVNSDQWSFGFNHIASDVGIGLRLDLPIGPLRLDYGYPVMRDGYNGGGRFNFNVGYQF